VLEALYVLVRVENEVLDLLLRQEAYCVCHHVAPIKWSIAMPRVAPWDTANIYHLIRVFNDLKLEPANSIRSYIVTRQNNRALCMTVVEIFSSCWGASPAPPVAGDRVLSRVPRDGAPRAVSAHAGHAPWRNSNSC
jgi:hypothetical protein